MATYVNFYTIAFEDTQGNPTSHNLMEFFKKIEALANKDITKIDRKINGNQYRISSYYWPDIGEQYVIIPIGKVKNGAPYVETDDRKNLKELNQRVYDVNVLVYDITYKTMIMTNHQSAPSTKEVENYFNSFLAEDDPIRIRIRPIKYNTGIVSVRNADRIRSVIFTLNLTAGMANLFQTRIDEGESTYDYFKGVVRSAKEDMMGKTMKLEIGLGYEKKDVSLDKTVLLDLISTMNVDSDMISEIEVKYYDGSKTKIEKARIKSTEMILLHSFSLHGSKLAPEYLKHHLEEAYNGEYGKYAAQVREYYSLVTNCNDEYTFVSDWRGDVIVN